MKPIHLNLAARRAAPRYRRPLPRLTPDRTGGLDLFVRQYFTELFARLKPPFALVLDNYHELPAGSPLHDVIRQAVELAPRAGHVMILSRLEPPAAFARARLNETMSVVDDAMLRFTSDETRGRRRCASARSGAATSDAASAARRARASAVGRPWSASGTGPGLRWQTRCG